MFSRNQVRISPELHRRACAAAEKAGYSSVEEFIAHAVEQALVSLEEAEAKDAVTKQLQGLGYID